MTGFSGCCGQPVRRRRERRQVELLPANPKPKGGVPMIFLGSGRREVRGRASGLTYTVANHRRHLRVDPGDVDDLLRDKEFILRP
jgi:hypothetical protein